MIYANKFYPIDSEIGLIRGQIDDIAKFLVRWKSSLYESSGMTVDARPYKLPPEEMIPKLLPLTIPQVRRELLIATKSDWVVYLNNSVLGTDTGTAAYLARKLKTSWIRAVVTLSREELGKDISTPHAGTVFFKYEEFNDDEEVGKKRFIHLINEDGNWSYESGGTPFSFEDVEVSSSKKLRDRFSKELLFKYLRNLGVRLDDRDFCLNKGILVERSGSISALDQEFSLDGALFRHR